ncbi:PEP/pyruvate-binding domain-containing protein [Dongia deserti]|uniref:PEP/pyruvate-binding domain-containing protein n=1 Tax=Dongia deserti TaxID=2268030 RepID=UPI000E6563FA|nr:PEP/pyruvate-binding domain-containing protein [Dongia deserti]
MTQMIGALRDRMEVADFGGKAAALSRLVAMGFDVPPFIAVKPEAFRIDGLDAGVSAKLQQSLDDLGEGPFAVRSSGREEDGASHSHAGQFLSVLEVKKSEVGAKAIEVWRSGLTDTVRTYRLSKGLNADGGAPAVIVQRMVKARAAGVLFTADPVSGRRERLVVSAVAGLADRLVGGEIDGDDYVLDKADGRLIDGPDSGALRPADLEALAELAKRVETAFGCPQDIEWAFEDDRLFVLQARPITTSLQEAPISDPVVTIFDNSNIIESYPGITSILTYSFAQYVYARVYRVFVRLVGVDEATIRAHAAVFDNMLGRINGRIYYNLINWYRTLALLPGFAINRGYMETMMGVGEALPAAIVDAIAPPRARGLAVIGEWIRIGRVAFRLLFEAGRLKWSIAAFYRRLNRALEQPSDRLSTMPLTALAAEYRRIEAELLDRWDAPLINDFLCMMAFGASRKLLERWAGTEGLSAHNDIMIGQGDIVSAEPAQRIRSMGALIHGDTPLIARLAAGDRTALDARSDLAAAVKSYLEKFGDRCTEELKLESATLEDDPTPLLAAISAAAGAGDAHRPAVGIEARLNALFPHHPAKRWMARWVVGWAKARVRDRENLRFERTRIFGRARRLFLAIGRQFAALDVIEKPRDVLFLTVQEILGAIEGFGATADLKGLVAVRQREQERDRGLPEPLERVSIQGAVISGPSSSADTAPTQVADDRQRKGTGCSAGKVVAAARVVRDPRTESLAPGEILVARNTDPGWIAVFTNASAIVVERGSLLSHSAIVARELGIPCVVGIKGVLDWVRPGERLSVDGATGLVVKIDG